MAARTIRVKATSMDMRIDGIDEKDNQIVALCRAGIFTIEDLIEALSGDERIKVRNLGKDFE